MTPNEQLEERYAGRQSLLTAGLGGVPRGLTMTIETRTTGDLLYLLQRQYPDGVTTFAPCPICSTGSRGGGYCVKCICSELTRRGVYAPLVGSLHSMLEQRRDLNRRIASTVEAIQEQADAMQRWATTVEDTTPNDKLRGGALSRPSLSGLLGK